MKCPGINSRDEGRACVRNVTVFVRSFGERTKDLLIQTLQEMSFVAQVINIDGLGFEKCLERVYAEGAHISVPFLLTVDGDLLTTEPLLKKFIEISIDMMERNNSLVATYGLAFDKFSQDLRAVGIRLYKVEAMPQFSTLFQLYVKDRGFLRPEARTHQCMASQGYEIAEISSPCALHGFGQFKHDISRTLDLQMRKDPYALALWVSRWSSKKGDDEALRFALSSALRIRFGYMFPRWSRWMAEECISTPCGNPLCRKSTEYENYERMMRKLALRRPEYNGEARCFVGRYLYRLASYTRKRMLSLAFLVRALFFGLRNIDFKKIHR